MLTRFAYARAEQRLAELVTITSDEDARKRLAAEYRRRYNDAFSPDTIKNVETTARLFTRWCQESGHSPDLPISPLVIAEYVEYLSVRNKPHTIATKLWALGELHNAEFYPSPCRDRIVILALRAARRRHGVSTGQASPLCKKDILEAVVGLGSTPKDLRDRALMLVASDTWCRASEVVAMRLSDLTRQADGSGVVALRHSKVDTYGRAEFAYVSPRSVNAVFAWADVRGLRGEDFMFTPSKLGAGKTRLATATVSRIFKTRTGRSDVSSHSTRVGGVHDALRIGCDLTSIMIAGRWASPEMPALYGRKILASQSAAAKVCEAAEEDYFSASRGPAPH